MPQRPGTGEPQARLPAMASVGAAPAVVPGKVHIPRVRGMTRDRLDLRVVDLWQHGLSLVVAPAGSGKTTLLAAWAAAAAARGIPAAWYRAESTDGEAAGFLGYLEAAVSEAIPAGAPSTPASGRSARPRRSRPCRP